MNNLDIVKTDCYQQLIDNIKLKLGRKPGAQENLTPVFMKTFNLNIFLSERYAASISVLYSFQSMLDLISKA